MPSRFARLTAFSTRLLSAGESLVPGRMIRCSQPTAFVFCGLVRNGNKLLDLLFVVFLPFQGGKGENYSLELGSGCFVPGFEDQVIGMKAGDEKDLDITFPEDYAPELAGAQVVFKVKVHEVKEKQEPELDDEFAKDVS